MRFAFRIDAALRTESLHSQRKIRRLCALIRIRSRFYETMPAAFYLQNCVSPPHEDLANTCFCRCGTARKRARYVTSRREGPSERQPSRGRYSKGGGNGKWYRTDRSAPPLNGSWSGSAGCDTARARAKTQWKESIVGIRDARFSTAGIARLSARRGWAHPSGSGCSCWCWPAFRLRP